ncbi:hypothetical protein AB0I10_29310 [Streptomyces sp. NPDC050636]|uniref:hypothetical protein n=1 Tax=Streptomyces sp. NPDC050636 TaxID=3154510 RepID=UPI003431EF66
MSVRPKGNLAVRDGASSVQCHGLAGSGEFLLDLADCRFVHSVRERRISDHSAMTALLR